MPDCVRENDNMSEESLEGLKVLDVGHYIAGPFCAKLLAGFGAEVIKIERPGGDPARRDGPFPGDKPHPEKSGLFLYNNTRKKGITLNLKSQAGIEVFKELVSRADIVIENYSPRVMPGLGIGYDTLKEVNPRLIMTSISNFGQSGPYRDYRSWDIGMNASSGVMYLSGDPDMEPLQMPGSLAQYMGGLCAFFATLVAIEYLEHGGEGQAVDVSIQEATACLGFLYQAYWPFAGEQIKRWKVRPTNHPYGAYACKDGYVGVQAAPPRRWPAIAELMETPQLSDPKYATSLGRRQNADEIDSLMEPWLKQHNRKDIYHAAQKLKLPFGYLATSQDLVESQQLQTRGYLENVEHPEAGRLTYPGAPFKMSETPWQAERSPLLGEHNEEIYGTHLGYSKEELVRLGEQGVI